jgi:hypothetical protein
MAVTELIAARVARMSFCDPRYARIAKAKSGVCS